MEERTLDWIPRFDERSLDYRIRSLNPDLPLRTWRWSRTLWLDQGREGACTGFAMAHVLGTSPRRMSGIDDAFARERYRRARQEDEWPGENYEGSSVLGAMAASLEDGLIKSYYWATTLNEILYAASHIAPVDIGVDWFSDMYQPDANGFLHVSGGRVGGHSLQVGGVDLKKRAVILDNSWGKDWGVKGSALLSFDDLDKLRASQGEFAVARKTLK